VLTWLNDWGVGFGRDPVMVLCFTRGIFKSDAYKIGES